MDNNKSYTQVLKKYFNIDNFRSNQLDILKHIIEDKRDVCAIMHTGAGKSLLYQYPAVYLNKISLVISPLISLMNDQVMKLNNLQIESCCLNGTVPNKTTLKNEILKNKYRIIYTTPEYLITQQDFIERLSKENLLGLITLDEAHTVSSYGMDFRPSFKKLSCLKEWTANENIPIIALTATATIEVQNDIISTLEMNNPIILRCSFDRPNLTIKVFPKGNILDDLAPLIVKNESVIIYCQTRKLTDTISEKLQEYGIVSKAYHAGMSTEDREAVHSEFATKKISCITATIAFGMGIDITVRTIIHYGIPRNMESYYQEIGRAGRDGLESTCYLFYSLNDMSTNNYLINQIENQKYRKHMMSLALVMKNFIFHGGCRRKFILNYFGEEYKKDNCKKCDNCMNNKEILMCDFAKEAKILFETLELTKGGYGTTMLIHILRGSKNKKIPDHFKRSKLYGSGHNNGDAWWKIFIRMMLNLGYIKEKSISGGHGFTIGVANKGKDFLKSYTQNTELYLQVPEELKSYATFDNDDENDEDEMAPIIDILKELEKVNSDEENFQPLVSPRSSPPPPTESILSEEKEPKKQSPKKPSKKLKTYENTFRLYKEGKSVPEIAQELGFIKTTIESHIVKLYEKNYDIDLTPLGFNEQIFTTISENLEKHGSDRKLKDIKDSLPSGTTYLQIKLTMEKLKKNILKQ